MNRNKTSLDSYDAIPRDMRLYLSNYGKHFSKKMYEWAVSMMYKADGTGVPIIPKQEFEDKLKHFGIRLENDVLYDGMYVYSMAMSDFYGSSIIDEEHLLMFVKNYIDDPDAVDGFVFNRFYADCCLKGVPISWLEMM